MFASQGGDILQLLNWDGAVKCGEVLFHWKCILCTQNATEVSYFPTSPAIARRCVGAFDLVI
jgi:hypothetical protein